MFAVKRGALAATLALVGAFGLAPAASAQQAGELVSSQETDLGRPGMRAWRIAYWTRDASNRPRQVTGMVVAPLDRRGGDRRVIAWTHGTTGVVERCAPSLNADFAGITPALGEMVARGYVVVAPDYPGLGSAGAHPYLVGEDTARSVLDAVRAARAITESGAGRQFAVWGESQGGHAALWTATSAPRYAPDLSLVATAAAAPPTELPENLRKGSDASVRAMLTAYATYAWSRHFGADLGTLFNKVNQGVVTRLAENNCVELGKSPKLGTILGVLSVRGQLSKKDITRTPPWSAIARDNSVNPRAVSGPLLVAQSVKDPVVAPSVTRDFLRKRCRAGLPVRFISLPGGAHEHSARDSSKETLDWIDARFSGEPAPNDCKRI